MKKQPQKISKTTEPGAEIIEMPGYDNENKDALTILQQADAAEKNNDFELAEKLYKKQLQQKLFNPFVYTRLMIIYRKQKKYKEELELISKGWQHFKDDQTKRESKKNKNAAIKKISETLNKSLGLIDKKRNALYEPEPIATWKKRKATVEKKLKK